MPWLGTFGHVSSTFAGGVREQRLEFFFCIGSIGACAENPHIFSVNSRWRPVVWSFFLPRTPRQGLLRARRPLRSRPGVASVIWESLVSMRRCSREHFADNRSARSFIYID